jgi:DNA repair protein RecO (recombination protein O)
LYREQGVVLRTYRLGEADRIVVLCTAGRGKVRAVAKGVRKTTSRFGGRLEPTSHVALQLYEGRSLDTITQAETIDHNGAIRSDLDRLGKANAVLEVVDQVAQEGEPNPALYRMVVGALRALSAHDAPLLVPAFFLKLLALEGSAPLLDECAACGAGTDLVAFDLTVGGALCRDHRSGVPVSEDALRLCRRVLGGDLAAAMSEPWSPVVTEVDALATRALEASLERRLRAPHLLDRS